MKKIIVYLFLFVVFTGCDGGGSSSKNPGIAIPSTPSTFEGISDGTYSYRFFEKGKEDLDDCANIQDRSRIVVNKTAGGIFLKIEKILSNCTDPDDDSEIFYFTFINKSELGNVTKEGNNVAFSNGDEVILLTYVSDDGLNYDSELPFTSISKEDVSISFNDEKIAKNNFNLNMYVFKQLHNFNSISCEFSIFESPSFNVVILDQAVTGLLPLTTDVDTKQYLFSYVINGSNIDFTLSGDMITVPRSHFDDDFDLALFCKDTDGTEIHSSIEFDIE